MNKKIYFNILFILIYGYGFSQTLNINLSPNHAQKLSTIKSGHKRLVKFYKFYKKDSVKHFKKQDRHYRKLIDSAYRAEIKQERLNKKLAKRGVIIPSCQLARADSADREFKKWWKVLKDSTTSDSMKQIARVKVKEIALERASLNPSFQNLLNNYQLHGEATDWEKLCKAVPGVDTLRSVFNSSPDQLFSEAEKQAENRLTKSKSLAGLNGEFSKATEIQNLPEKYKQQYSKFTNKDSLTAEAKEKAVQQALDYFSEHGKELQAVQQKASSLLAKYKDYTNSNDLSNGIKQTSLKGKTLWERIVLSGNFNVVSTSPFSIDLSPLVGYKFNTKFFMGLGMNYRYTYKDSIRYSWYVSPSNSSFKAFASHDFIKNFYAYMEWEKSSVSIRNDERMQKKWMNNYFIGIGKRLAIHPKLYMTITALYNLNSDSKNPVHPNRFQIRTGFQLSELATRKKKVYYNPNK